MSLYPNRKKLTEYPTVTPTLADSVVNIQNSTVKQSTLQSILNLFNGNLPQATEFNKGAALLTSQADAELAATESVVANIDHTKIITPRGWRWAWNKALTLAWTFAEKISFSKGINLVNSATPTANGDVTFNNTQYYGRINNSVVTFITNASAASESDRGVLLLASTTDANNAGDLSINISTLNDTKAMTPKKWRQAYNNSVFNAANVSIGANPRSINSTSGVATFTDRLASGAASTFILQNTLVTTASIIQYSVKYENSNQAIPIVSSYSIDPAGSIIRFNVNNIGNQSTNANISISFTILNP
jgi:hypothetical protein